MNHPRRKRPAHSLTLLGAALLLGAIAQAAGCGGPGPDDYVPPSDSARSALTAALDAWQRGEAPGRLEGDPAIHVGDTHRRPGQTLGSYEILGELPVADGRRFAVRLTLANPAQEEKANYLVIGIDPLWVFREEDYRMVTHWDHNMPAPAPAQDPAPQTP
jgi:hypothetical protein